MLLLVKHAFFVMQKADFELISFSYDLQGLGVVAGRFGGGCDPEPPPLLPPPPVLQLYSLFIFKTSTCPIQKNRWKETAVLLYIL
jgi:hypothetical protein